MALIRLVLEIKLRESVLVLYLVIVARYMVATVATAILQQLKRRTKREWTAVGRKAKKMQQNGD